MPKGPPTSFVRDARGNVINGLRVQKAKNRDGRTIDRFYALYGNGKRKYFGNSKNQRSAILRYRQWEAGQERDTVSFPGKKLKLSEVDGGLEAALMEREIEITIDEQGDFDVAQRIPSDAFWVVVRNQVLTNPQLAAQKTGIEQLAYLHRLEPPPPSKTLEDIVTLYLGDKKAELTPAEWKNSRTWWDEFRKITGAETVAELDRSRFRKYRIEILDSMKARGRSNTWARSRFGKVKTIINHVLDEADFSQEDRVFLQLRSLLKQPSKPAPNPVDITPAELRKILSKADDWEAALILTALNYAYYQVDCQRLRWSMINFAKGTIRFDRTKSTGRAKGPVPRVAVLWQRIIRAMKKLDRGHDHVFVSTYRRPVHIETVRRHWIGRVSSAVDRWWSGGRLMRSRRSGVEPARLEAARRRFEHWRLTRERRSRIPDRLWRSAVKLSATYGLYRTAKVLRLNPDSFKKRVVGGSSLKNRVPAGGGGDSGGRRTVRSRSTGQRVVRPSMAGEKAVRSRERRQEANRQKTPLRKTAPAKTVRTKTDEKKRAMTFVELNPLGQVVASECLVELEHPRGAKMRIRFTSAPSPEVVAALSRVFLGVEP